MKKVKINKSGYYSTNFIDENNTFVGWEEESFRYDNYGDVLYSMDEDSSLQEFKGETDGYLFDTKYVNNNFDDSRLKEIGIEFYDCIWAVEFRLTKLNEPDIYLLLYNSHNGYYSHGFEFVVNGNIIEEGYL